MRKKLLVVFLSIAIFMTQAITTFAAYDEGANASVISTTSATAATIDADSVHEIININEGWLFAKAVGAPNDEPENLSGTEYTYDSDTTGWEEVDVPHTWNNEDGMDGGDDYWRGDTWYRKTVTFDSETYAGKSVYLEINAAAIQTQVYLNGELLTYVDYTGATIDTHKGGYSTFRYDITDAVNFDADNELALMVSNYDTGDVIPLGGDYTVYGGLYRDVNIIVVDEVHIDLENEGSDGVFITPTLVDEATNEWEIAVDTALTNNTGAEKTVTVQMTLREVESFDELIDPDWTPFDEDSMWGNEIFGTITKEVTLPAGTTTDVSLLMTASDVSELLDPRLWAGVDDPYRYQVDITILDENDVTLDDFSDCTGLRTFYATVEGGFFLNGESYPLRGVCMHQDYADLGYAITTEIQEENISMIYEMGANAVRLSHYQHDTYTYELCDQYGLAVWAEIPLTNFSSPYSSTSDYDEFERTTSSQLVELIRQEYNTSAILFWGLQNETSGTKDIVAVLDALAHEEDSTRLTTQATNFNNISGFSSDLYARNLYPGWYNITGYDKSPETIGVIMDDIVVANEGYGDDRSVGISEYGAGGSIYQHEYITEEDGGTIGSSSSWHPEEYQTMSHRVQVAEIEERDYLWGTFLWNMFDFGSDSRSEGDADGMNDKGLVTADREVKKDAFYVYKATWSDIPFVHIDSSRYEPQTLNIIPVRVSSNCDSVELIVNGETVSTLTQADLDQSGMYYWEDVALVAGKNTVTAIGKNYDEEDVTYEETITWTKTISSTPSISSSTLTINTSNKTINLDETVAVADLDNHISSTTGSTWVLYAADGTTLVTSGDVAQGMKLVVTAEDGVATVTYTFTQDSLATDKSVVVNGVADANSALTDGDWGTTWSASDATTFPQTILIDLGAVYNLNQSTIHFSTSAKFYYNIYVSDDGETYTLAMDGSNSYGTTVSGSATDCLNGVSGRYFKIEILSSSSTLTAATIEEVEVYGWRMDDTTYTIDEIGKLIYVPEVLGEVATQTFLEAVNITGNYSVDLRSESYFVVDGDLLHITGTNGTVTTYTLVRDDEVSHVVNLASGASITTTSEELRGTTSSTTNGGNLARLAIDGDLTTRWSAEKYVETSSTSYPESIELDLGSVCDIESFETYFYNYGANDRGYKYIIYGKENAEDDYVVLVDNSSNTDKSGIETDVLAASVQARYIKLEITGCTKTQSYIAASVYEFAVYGVKAALVIDVESLTLSESALAIPKESSATLTYTLLPENASDKSVVWESDDETVATVEGGVVTAVSVGTATITVTSADGVHSDSCTVTVSERDPIISMGSDVVLSTEGGEENTTNVLTNINDGVLSTRWAAAKVNNKATFPQSVVMDLGAIYNISEIELQLLTAEITTTLTSRYYTFYVEISTDGESYTEIIDGRENSDTSGLVISFLDVTAQYVRVTVLGGYNADGSTNSYALASIHELTVRGVEPSAVVTTALSTAITEAQALVEAEYTAKSWETLATALADAQTTLANESATQSEIDTATTTLNAAIKALVDAPAEQDPIISIDKDVLFSTERLEDNGTWSYAKYINDGDIDTRWAAEKVGTLANFPEYVTIDLGSVYDVSCVDLQLLTADLTTYTERYYTFYIEVSLDNVTYTEIYDGRANTDTAGFFSQALSDTQARYVRVTVTGGYNADGSANKWALASIHELTVYGELSDDQPAVSVRNVASVADQADVSVEYGTAAEDITLPTTVEVTFDDVDATVESVDVVWACANYDANTAGDYTFTGTLTMTGTDTNTDSVTASVKVTVDAEVVVATPTPTATPEPDPTATATAVPTATATASTSTGTTATATPVATAVPTAAPTATPTAAPVATSAPTVAPTAAPVASASVAIVPDNADAAVVTQAIDDAITQALSENEGAEELAVEIKVETAADTVETTITSDTLAAMVDANVSELVIGSDTATLTLDATAIASLADSGASSLTLQVTKMDNTTLAEDVKEIVGDAPVFDLTMLTEDGSVISTFNGGTITVSLPYTLAEGESASDITVYYIDDDGNVSEMTGTTYDAASGTVTFTTTHFSYYTIQSVATSVDAGTNYTILIAGAIAVILVLAVGGVVIARKRKEEYEED